MNRKTVPLLPTAVSPTPRSLCPAALRAVAIAFVSITLLAALTAGPAAVQASEAPTERPAGPHRRVPQPQQGEQLVFSMGVLTAVDGQTVTIGFIVGRPETYRISTTTTIQSQHGDAQTVRDLEIGAEVIVLSHEGNPTALTIVNGGDAGFAEAGPPDLRGHEQDEACAPCSGASAP